MSVAAANFVERIQGSVAFAKLKLWVKLRISLFACVKCSDFSLVCHPAYSEGKIGMFNFFRFFGIPELRSLFSMIRFASGVLGSRVSGVVISVM